MFRRTAARLIYSPPQLSVADCGVKVVTYNEKNPVSAVGLFTMIGPRYENEATEGCGYVHEKLSWVMKGTGKESFHLQQGQVQVVNNREVLQHSIECLRWEVEVALETLARMGVAPVVNAETVAAAKALAAEAAQRMDQNPREVLFELLHRAAWQGNTLGRPRLDLDFSGEGDMYPHVTPELLQQYHSQFLTSDRVTVAACGVEHADLLRLVDKVIGPIVAPPKPIPGELLRPAEYTGGVELMHNLEAPQSLMKFEEDNHTLVGIMLQQPGLGQNTAGGVISSLLGGGSSFASGGPGKGSYTKLFRESLCRHAWLKHIEGLSSAYSDSGTLGLFGEASHDDAARLYSEIHAHASSLSDRLYDAFVTMGQNRFLAAKHRRIEERAQSLEDIGRYVATTGRLEDMRQLVSEAQAVTKQSIEDYIAMCASKPPCVAVYGQIEALPPKEQMLQLSKRNSW